MLSKFKLLFEQSSFFKKISQYKVVKNLLGLSSTEGPSRSEIDITQATMLLKCYSWQQINSERYPNATVVDLFSEVVEAMPVSERTEYVQRSINTQIVNMFIDIIKQQHEIANATEMKKVLLRILLSSY